MLADHLTIRAVGVSFRDTYPGNLRKLGKLIGDGETVEVQLIREPDNSHDPNAVQLVCRDIGWFGYVPARLARLIAPEMDAGAVWRGRVEQVFVMPSNPDQPGVDVHIARGDDEFQDSHDRGSA